MKAFQPIWEKLFHFSKIGMNFWGGATFSHSGEIYALKYAKEKLSGKSNPVIFDVGANVGEYAFAAAEIFGKKCVIYSFEPSGFTFRALHKSIQDSSASEYIRAENFGYSDSRAKVNLYSSGRGATIASVYELKRSSVEFKKEFIEEIELRTIDDYCTENDIQNIDYLKVDIEGHEYQALLGAIKMIEAKRIKFIQFEFGECHIDSRTFFRDFYELLSPHYRFHRIVSDGIREVKEYSTDLEVFDTVNYLLELK
ncbi:MAG: FkbM family methyltransferase [Bacteroidota bacterium]|nr:FkbM family methyltransferase [Bacteroidota bacterium]